MKKRIRPFLFLLSVLMCLSSCLTREEYTQEEVDALMQEEFEERVSDYRRIRTERCNDDILEKANELADSILLVESRRLVDSSKVPPLPERPAMRRVKTLKDSTELKPLFENQEN